MTTKIDRCCNFCLFMIKNIRLCFCLLSLSCHCSIFFMALLLINKTFQVPAMPLAFYNRQGKLTRFNLRKFTELPFQLVRCFRYKDLYDNVLFNYQWLYHKMCALPLPEVLCDFEDATKNIRLDPMKHDNIVKEISLVADSLRLGGAILKFYPGMLSAQLVGRLLPEIEHSDNIRNLLRQCVG